MCRENVLTLPVPHMNSSSFLFHPLTPSLTVRSVSCVHTPCAHSQCSCPDLQLQPFTLGRPPDWRPLRVKASLPGTQYPPRLTQGVSAVNPHKMSRACALHIHSLPPLCTGEAIPPLPLPCSPKETEPRNWYVGFVRKP